MNFTKEEKKACLLILMSLTDCDGRRNEQEIEMLLRCNTVLGVTHEDMIGGILTAVHMMSLSDVKSVVKAMTPLKKTVLEECMGKIIEADGPANETEIGTWWSIQMQLELPSWVASKNDR